MGITELGYIGVGVSDGVQWQVFATEILGLEVFEREADGTCYLRMDEYHHRIVLHPDGSDDLLYVGWGVPTEADLQEATSRLEAAGVAVARGTPEEIARRRVLDLVKFDDPNGVPSEIFFGLLVASERPFCPGRPIQGFKTGGLGLGHIVLAAKDLETTIHFYRDLLGLRISDVIDMNRVFPWMGDAVFFRCNPRHHSVAFAQLPAPKRIHHFMLELNSLDDVGRALDLCQERGVPLSMSLGRHSNDRMISFYMANPSGFDVEYGWGGRLIDEATWVIQKHLVPSIWGHRPMALPESRQQSA